MLENGVTWLLKGLTTSDPVADLKPVVAKAALDSRETLNSTSVSANDLSKAAVATYQTGPLVFNEHPRILGSASSFAPWLTKQEDIKNAFIKQHPNLSPADVDFVSRVFDQTHFDTCSLYVNKDDIFRKMSRVEYVEHIKPKLFDLGNRAAAEAIKNWGGDPTKITHLVWGTMTGSIHAPTMDINIARALGLSTNIKRLSIEGMGCLTGFRCLALATDLARARADNVILVITADIRSALGNQLSPHKAGEKIDRSNVIVSALFRDSGAACVISRGTFQNATPRITQTPHLATGIPTAITEPSWEVLNHESFLVPDSEHLVQMAERDDAVVHLYIAKELPDEIGKHLPGVVDRLLAPAGIKLDQVCFAVHTGGPKVLRVVSESLNVSPRRMGASWWVMQKYGNLSGSSNLVVLDHMGKLQSFKHGEHENEISQYCVCISFGPGVGMETVLLRNTNVVSV
ncbi:hypothetical protein HK101_002179 [Irineochytrium annulatum]|nr:hypothetical protein HK101_002179 [Irineochytrium annulatum]